MGINDGDIADGEALSLAVGLPLTHITAAPPPILMVGPGFCAQVCRHAHEQSRSQVASSMRKIKGGGWDEGVGGAVNL